MKNIDNYIIALAIALVVLLVFTLTGWGTPSCKRSHTIISAELIPTKSGLLGNSTQLQRAVHFDDGDVSLDYFGKIGDVECID